MRRIAVYAAVATAFFGSALPAGAIPVASVAQPFPPPVELRVPGSDRVTAVPPDRLLRTPGLRTTAVPLSDPLIERGRAQVTILVRHLAGLPPKRGLKTRRSL